MTALRKHRFAWAVGLAGFVMFSLPVSYYAWRRASGRLVSEAEWWAQRTNHGPWRWEWPGNLLLLSLFVLLAGSVVLAVIAVGVAIKRRQVSHFFVIGAVAAMYFALSCLQLRWLYWTID